MGLLNFMPGEMGGQPQGLLGGAFENPLFQAGISILANNSGHYGALGPAIGGGLQQAGQNIQRQKQFAMDKQWRDVQMKNAQRQLDEDQRISDARAAFKLKHPELADLVDLEPSLAIKSAYPNVSSNSADPYFSDRYIGGKVYAFNHRTGNYEEKHFDNPLPNKDDPIIQGNVKGAEARAGAAWKPNTSIDGQIMTDEQIASMAYGNGQIPFMPNLPTGLPQQQPSPQQPQPQAPQMPTNNFNTPYPVTFGAPGTTATDRAEGVTSDASIQLRNPARPNVGGGVKVKTAAELAADKKAAESQAEFNAPDAVAKREKAKEFKQTMGKVVIDKIDDVMGRVGGMTAGLGGRVLDGVPGTDAYDLKSDLETIKANFGFDRLQAMRDMSPTGGALGQVAVQELSALQASVANLDNAQSPKQLKDNLQKAKDHYNNWLSTLEENPNKKQILPSGQAGGKVPKTYDSLPKRAPKGQIVRNPQTGERMQFDGLKWNPL